MSATLDADQIGRMLERARARQGGAWADLFLEARAVHRVGPGDPSSEIALDSGGAIRVLGAGAGARQSGLSGGWSECCELLAAGVFDGGHRSPATGEPDEHLAEVSSQAAEAGRRLGEYLAELQCHLERCIPPGSSIRVDAEASVQKIRHQSTKSQGVEDTREGVLVRVTPDQGMRALPAFTLAGESVEDVRRRHPTDVCAARIAEAIALEAGKPVWGPEPEFETAVVLAPGTAGLFFHEAVGHLLQGDGSHALREGSGSLSPLLTVVEHPSHARGRGRYRIDDEGVAPRPVILVEQGRVTGRLASRGGDGSPAKSSGSGRRQSFRDAVVARLAATCVSAGQDDPADIVSSTGRGILVQDIRSGSVDPVSGEFTLHATRGRMIERGRLAGATGEFLILGTVPNTLRTIDRIAHDAGDDGGASVCVHNGQAVPVTVGLPTLRIVTIRVRSLEMMRI